MKKNKGLIFLASLLTIFFVGIANAEAKTVNVYFFNMNGCSHCAEAKEFFAELEADEEYKDMFAVQSFEVSTSRENSELMDEAAEIMGDDNKGAVPYIIVGDEYQLPPIKQLVVTQDVESVISLALKKSLFKIYSLKCHYRSETESLIAYSRDRYYTEMLTFPSPEPFGNHLGLKDVYLEEANLDGGENISEAKTVVSLIKKHFDDFYDETKRCLDEEHSLGIITFGEAQSKLIEKLIYQDEELKTKITETLANYKDVSEKIFFIKTIRNVQGFEIAHLIISFTYGRSKSGEINNKFYNLGTKKLGECMFNVAVTRAQKEVIAVHSIRSYELKTENSQNIADYLESCERFEKFKVIDTNIYGYEANNGFEYNILNELIKAGVSKQNVLFNYGATGGSIRIPLVILDRTHSKVKCGLWLEKQTNIYYLDYNMHYYDILVDRGFKLYKVYLEDYMFNKEATLAKILSFIKESGGL